MFFLISEGGGSWDGFSYNVKGKISHVTGKYLFVIEKCFQNYLHPTNAVAELSRV